MGTTKAAGSAWTAVPTQLLGDGNICIRVTQAKAMDLHAQLSQLLGTCPQENRLVVDMLEAELAPGVTRCWGGEHKSSEQVSVFFQVLQLPEILPLFFAHPKFDTSPKSTTLVTEDVVALHC